MDKKTTKRIIGTLVVIALTIIALPLFFNSNYTPTVQTAAIAPPFPNPQNQMNTNSIFAENTTTPATTTQDAASTAASTENTQAATSATPASTTTQAMTATSPTEATSATTVASSETTSTATAAAPGATPAITAATPETTPAITTTTPETTPTGTAATPEAISTTAAISLTAAGVSSPETPTTAPSAEAAPTTSSQKTTSTTALTTPQETIPQAKAQKTGSSPAKQSVMAISTPAAKKLAQTAVDTGPANEALASASLASLSLPSDQEPVADPNSVVIIGDDGEAKQVSLNEKTASNPTAITTAKLNPANLKKTAWVVQLGSFKNKLNAERLTNSLRAKGYKAFTFETKSNGQTRVYVGPEFKQLAASSLITKIDQDIKIHGVLVTYKPLEL